MGGQTQPRKNAVGTSMAEYAIIGALIGVVSIGALVATSKGFGGLLATLNQDMKDRAQSATQLAATAPISVTAPYSPAGDAATPTTSDSANNSLQVSNGTLYLSTYPTDLTQSIETAGAKGTTMSLLETMVAYANQQLQEGKITQDQANSIIAVANQGHVMANITGLIEQTAQSTGMNGEAFNGTMVNFNGRNISMGELAKTINADNPAGGSQKYTNPVTAPDGTKFNAGSELASFFNLLSSMNSDPSIGSETKDVVNVLAGQVASISQGAGCAAFSMGYTNDGTTPNITQGTLHWMEEQKLTPKLANSLYDLPSVQADQKSADICKAGGGKDSNNNCKAS